MEKLISLREDKVAEILAQKIAAYWNGKTITATGSAQWSDFDAYERTRTVTDPETGETTTETYLQRDRVPGTFDKVNNGNVVGVIQATANGPTVEINIVYNIQITNVG